MATSTILVVDDEPLIRWPLTERLKSEGYAVLEAETGAMALEELTEGVDLVLLDYKLPDIDGVSVLRKIKGLDQDTPVVLLTAYTTLGTAVEAMKLGAYDVVNKPFSLDEVVATVERGLEVKRLRREVRQYQASASRRYNLHSIVGSSLSMTALRHLVAKVATSPASTVLLTGESGTGKKLVAKIIHYTSDRALRPLVNITCSLPEQLLESELFGHERGAFTDAPSQKRGLLETADGGTVFLDEISEMVPALQAKLLRFLEENAFKRVGSTQDIRVDVRIIAATNRNLEEETNKGRFRRDLYHRLNALAIGLPPLRTHTEDIPMLVEYFIDGFSDEFRKRIVGATPSAYAVLERYGWPGNVRELRNVVERAMLLSDSSRLDAETFAALTDSTPSDGAFELPAKGVDVEKLERSLVIQALKRSGGNQTKAAALLGLNRDQIRYRIEKFELSVTH